MSAGIDNAPALPSDVIKKGKLIVRGTMPDPLDKKGGKKIPSFNKQKVFFPFFV
jgi:hypothetical protein